MLGKLTKKESELPYEAKMDIMKGHIEKHVKKLKRGNYKFIPTYEFPSYIDRVSTTEAIDFIDYCKAKDKINIRHGFEPTTTKSSMKRKLNSGELVVAYYDVSKGNIEKSMFIDGFCEETRTLYEYYGEYFHGRLDGLNGGLKNKKGNKTYKQMRIKTIEREDKLRDLFGISNKVEILPDGSICYGESPGYRLICMWQEQWYKFSGREEEKNSYRQ